MPEIRAFIGLSLNREFVEQLSKAQDLLKEAGCEVKWVKPENLHVTVKFIGAIDETKLNGLLVELSGALSGSKPFNISLSALGAFPSLKKIKVIWAGVNSAGDDLKRVFDKTENAMKAAAFETEEKEFKAHITLGRLNNFKDKRRLGELIPKIKLNPLTMPINKVRVYKSTLSQDGPIYEIIKDIDL